MALPAGLTLESYDDPTGNGQDTRAVLLNGKSLGVYIVGHNSDGPIIVLGAADNQDGLRLASASQSVTVTPGALSVQTLG